MNTVINLSVPYNASKILDYLGNYKIYWVTKLLNMQFPSVSCFSLLAPDIYLNTLFSNILSLCSSLNIINHVSHRHTTGTVSFGMTSHCDI